MKKETSNFELWLKESGFEKEVKPLEESWDQHNWDDGVFVGQFIAEEKILPGAAANGEDLILLGFVNVLDGKKYGFAKGYKLAEMMEVGSLEDGGFYAIEQGEKKDIGGGKTLNFPKIYPLKKKHVDQWIKDYGKATGKVDNSVPF